MADVDDFYQLPEKADPPAAADAEQTDLEERLAALEQLQTVGQMK